MLLECRGWWSTLDWLYYEDASGVEEYAETGTGVESVGTTTKQVVRQSFSLVAGTTTWNADTVYVRVRKQGSPTDYLRVAITNSGGTVLAYKDVLGSDLNTNLQWIQCVLNTTTPLVDGSTYYVRLSRSGANSDTDYYVVDVVDPPGYARGSYTYWNGAAWVAASPNVDMVFRVTGVEEVSAQIQRLLTNAGQFFTRVNIMNTSGVYTNPYCNGEQSAKAVVQALLETGTANSRRLLARVHPDRSVEIYEEPDVADATMTLDSRNVIRTRINEVVPKSQTPYGQWVRLTDIIPASVNTALMADARTMFVEGFEYSIPDDALTLLLKGVKLVSDIGSIDQG